VENIIIYVCVFLRIYLQKCPIFAERTNGNASSAGTHPRCGSLVTSAQVKAMGKWRSQIYDKTYFKIDDTETWRCAYSLHRISLVASNLMHWVDFADLGTLAIILHSINQCRPLHWQVKFDFDCLIHILMRMWGTPNRVCSCFIGQEIMHLYLFSICK
jgi:hypothetical protein